MRLWKVQALGNDFVLLDDRDRTLQIDSATVRKLCDRNFGVGADGLLIVRTPSDTSVADFQMVYFNADGSEAGMCGNGIRCFAKYLFDHGLTTKTSGLPILTGAGVKVVDLVVSNGKAVSVTVDMGAPIFEPGLIPISPDVDPLAFDLTIDIGGDPATFDASSASMGNPHCVLFLDDLSTAPVTTAGPLIENHPWFPERTNVQFVQVLSRSEVRARIWERGVGETMASGTSSCAITAAGVRRGILDRKVKVHLPGGILDIHWTEEGPILMTGPASESFSAELDPAALPSRPPQDMYVNLVKTS